MENLTLPAAQADNIEVSEFRVECPKCDKFFDKGSPGRSQQALKMHMGRVHGNIQQKRGKRKTRGYRKSSISRIARTAKINKPDQIVAGCKHCPNCGAFLENYHTVAKMEAARIDKSH